MMQSSRLVLFPRPCGDMEILPFQAEDFLFATASLLQEDMVQIPQPSPCFSPVWPLSSWNPSLQLSVSRSVCCSSAADSLSAPGSPRTQWAAAHRPAYRMGAR